MGIQNQTRPWLRFSSDAQGYATGQFGKNYPGDRTNSAYRAWFRRMVRKPLSPCRRRGTGRVDVSAKNPAQLKICRGAPIAGTDVDDPAEDLVFGRMASRRWRIPVLTCKRMETDPGVLDTRAELARRVSATMPLLLLAQQLLAIHIWSHHREVSENGGRMKVAPNRMWFAPAC